MITNVKATGLELTSAISNFIKEKLSYLEKRLGEYADETKAMVEVGMITKHHKAGQIFRAEINLVYRGKQMRAVIESDDLYLAIDGAKDMMLREVNKYDKKQNSLIRRGGRAIKNIFRSRR